MRKLYKNFIRSMVAAGCICLSTGCGIVKSYSGAETTVNAEEISEEQFLEIVSPEKIVLCQVVEPNDVIAFIQNEKMEEWEYVSEIPMQAKLQYIITSYEKISEEFWKKKGVPEISIGKETLYEDNGDFYMESVFEGDSTYCRIPESAGEYIMELASNSSDMIDGVSMISMLKPKMEPPLKSRIKSQNRKMSRIIIYTVRMNLQRFQKNKK